MKPLAASPIQPEPNTRTIRGALFVWFTEAAAERARVVGWATALRDKRAFRETLLVAARPAALALTGDPHAVAEEASRAIGRDAEIALSISEIVALGNKGDR